MKKFLTTIFVILLVAVIAIFGYGYLSNGKQASPETLDIVEKVKDVPLTTTDGSEMSIDDIISTDSEGKLQVDTQALQNISSDSLQAVANQLSEEDVDNLKKEVLSNPELMTELWQYIK